MNARWDADAAEEPSDQLTAEDMLETGPVDDLLDTGFDVPERESKAARIARDHGASTLEDEVAATEPEVWDESYVGPDTTRAGRLLADDSEFGEQDITARDVGVDGGAASAEEAAMHIVKPPRAGA